MIKETKYEIPEEQGMAALFAGIRLAGMSLKSLTRRKGKVVIICEDNKQVNAMTDWKEFMKKLETEIRQRPASERVNMGLLDSDRQSYTATTETKTSKETCKPMADKS